MEEGYLDANRQPESSSPPLDTPPPSPPAASFQRLNIVKSEKPEPFKRNGLNGRKKKDFGQNEEGAFHTLGANRPRSCFLPPHPFSFPKFCLDLIKGGIRIFELVSRRKEDIS